MQEQIRSRWSDLRKLSFRLFHRQSWQDPAREGKKAEKGGHPGVIGASWGSRTKQSRAEQMVGPKKPKF